MDPNFEVNLTAYKKLDKEKDTTQQTPSSPLLIRKKPKSRSPRTPESDKKKKTRVATGKKKPKKRKTKRKVKKPKRKTKRKARGLVNEQFMNSLTDNRYIPDNRSGIQLLEHQSYGMNPDGSRITPRVEGKIKTTRTLVQNPKPTIKKSRKHK